ncbi:MAG: LamB/YcsF family protein [Planctomycetes bacterium]|nr:LamB/YcsF family protein [Planctomycetota bacterium]
MILDLNSDLGEGCGLDAELMPLVTSANICCGFHAGDSTTAHAALQLAVKHGVQVGAHPGYADREHFGRRELALGQDAIFELCVYQVGALMGLAKAVGMPIRYVKPHGGLYNQACREDTVALPIVKAAELLQLPVMALPGSRLEALCQGRCGFIAEGFADRRYLPDGTLVPRSRRDAFMHEVDEAVNQADWLIHERGVRTLCVHGDNPQALDFVRGLRDAFSKRGITLKAFP